MNTELRILSGVSGFAAGSNRLASQSIAGPSGTTSRSFTYNARGDVTDETRDGAATSASYDAYGRLAAYTRTGTPSFAMLYSGTDERVQVSVDGTPRRFVQENSGASILNCLHGRLDIAQIRPARHEAGAGGQAAAFAVEEAA
jgi:YD repeat-containing protein